MILTISPSVMTYVEGMKEPAEIWKTLEKGINQRPGEADSKPSTPSRSPRPSAPLKERHWPYEPKGWEILPTAVSQISPNYDTNPSFFPLPSISVFSHPPKVAEIDDHRT